MNYDVSTVERLTGIPRATLLAWERRYGVVQPARRNNGYRAYSEEEVSTLRRVKALTESGVRIGEAVRRVGRVHEGGEHALMLVAAAVRDFDREQLDVLSVALADLGLLAALREIYEPLLDHMTGPEWSESQRRWGRSWLDRRLHEMLSETGWGPGSRAPVVVARLDEDEQRGLIEQLHLVLRGCSVVALGTQPSSEALCDAVGRSGASAICLGGVSGAHSGWVLELRARAPAAVGLLLIGSTVGAGLGKGIQVLTHASRVDPDWRVL